MYKKRRVVVRRRPVVRRRGRGIVDRVKQAARYALPIAAAYGAKRLIPMGVNSAMGQRVMNRLGDYAIDKAKDLLRKEVARMAGRI